MNRKYIANIFSNKFKKKKVLIIDLETTGLPQKKCRDYINPCNEYYNPKDIKYYDSSRIVQFSWYILDFNNIQKNISIETVKNFIVKCNFDIPDFATKIHGIDNNLSQTKGININDIFNELNTDLINSNIFLAHNTLFDYNVLMSELYRYKKLNMIKILNDMMFKGKVYCSGLITKYILKLGKYKNKMPKLKELYFYCFDKEPENQHDAKYDVFALIEIITGNQYL